MGIERLRKLFPITTLCVISEESMKPLCKKYNIEYVYHKNQPLGEKKNYGLTEAFKRPWDYLLEIGSDDLIKNEAIDAYLKQQRAMMSLGSFCYLNSEDGECRKIENNTTYGIGRWIERGALERCSKGVVIEAKDDLMSPGRTVNKGELGFFPLESAKQMEAVGQAKIIGGEVHKLWKDSLTRCLDNDSTFFMATQGLIAYKVKFSEPVAIDIKGKDNIWTFNPDAGTPYGLEKVLQGLSEDEKTAIKSLINGNQSN